MCLASARRAHEAQDQPDWDNDDRAEEEIAPYPAHRIEAHVPDRLHHAADAVDDIAGIESQRMQDDADQYAQEYKAEEHRERRPSEEAAVAGVRKGRALVDLAHGGHVIMNRWRAVAGTPD